MNLHDSPYCSFQFKEDKEKSNVHERMCKTPAILYMHVIPGSANNHKQMAKDFTHIVLEPFFDLNCWADMYT